MYRTTLCMVALLCFVIQLPLAATASADELIPGVSLKVFHLSKPYERIPTLVAGQDPNFHTIVPSITFSGRRDFGNRQRYFYVEVDAVLRVKKAGEYSFRLLSDDGSKLVINAQVVIDNDGLVTGKPKDGAIELDAADHVLSIHMFQAIQESGLTLQWKSPGSNQFEPIPVGSLFNRVGKDIKTSGGNKTVAQRGIRTPRPGAGQPLDRPHPGFTIEQARPDGFEPSVGAIQFLPDGKLALTTFPPKNNGVFRDEYNGGLYILDNVTAKDTSKITVREISTELHDPLGMNFVNGALYICDRNEISKWVDTDGDGYPDGRESFASGWVSDNYHHFTFGLPYYDGHFYLSLSTNITFNKMIEEENIEGDIVGLNGPNPEHRGSLLKVDADTGDFTVVSGGLRTPNGVSLGPDGLIVIPDNQGAFRPASAIYAAKQGAFFGHYNEAKATSDFYPDGGVPSAFSDQPVTPPAVYLPQNEISNSPAEMVLIPDGQPHAGQMLMAEITLGGLRRVFLENVEGIWQGAVFRHSQGFEAGLNRLAWGPDGCLYVGGMGGGGNWGWRGKRFGLQRMAPSDKVAFEFETIETTANGFRVSFTKPVSKAQLEDLNAWAIDAWTYKPDAKYGGPKIDLHRADPTQAVASEDRMSALLTVPNRKPDYVYHLRTDPQADDGDSMWSPEAWYTFHRSPSK
ncbi:MAG: PA14 domain-containing protein [Phycisphaeraceae bacterium]